MYKQTLIIKILNVNLQIIPNNFMLVLIISYILYLISIIGYKKSVDKRYIIIV